MKEKAEFRIPAEHAKRLFGPNEGQDLGSVIKISIDTRDPRYPEIGVLQKKLHEKGKFFFAGWYIDRKYTREEISAAELFHLDVWQRFEPAGEECGTQYDETTACGLCGSDAKQITPLRLKKSSIPKAKDFSRTIANVEIVVSRKAADLFKKHDVTGIEYGPILSGLRSGDALTEWCQLLLTNKSVEISSSTRFGITPFDVDERGHYLCANDHKAGFNKLSELQIEKRTRGVEDFVATRKFVGQRLGLLRPRRLICVSQKVRKIIEDHKLKGCQLEVAYLN